MHGRPAPQTSDHPRASHPQRWRILGVLVLALLVTSIDHTIINVALPQLVGDLGASAAQLQWVVAGYTVVFAGLLLTAGSLGDRFGRRRALLIGLATFLAGSIAAALAGSTTTLILARCVMGLGGALIMPTTLSILVNAFGDPRERAKAIAVWTAASGAGIALGPIVGGALMRSFSWSSVFWINVPLLLAALAGGLHLVPDSRDPNATRLDPVGALLSIVAVSSFVYAIIQGPDYGWTSGRTLAFFAVGAVTASVFVAWEAHRDDPMLDLRLFRHRGFSVASIALAMLFFAMAGAVFLQAQYLQFILGYSPLAAGFALVPAALGMLLGTGAGAHLEAHMGSRKAVATGTVLAASGLAVQAAFIDGTSYTPTGVGLLLFGLGAGVAMPAATDLIMATLPPSRAGVGSAVNDTVRELGGALGVAVIGSVAATSYSSSLSGDLARFPELTDPVRSVLTDNVGAATEMSRQLGAHGAEIASLAHNAFVSSMSGALWLAAAAAAAAAVLAITRLPRDAVGGHGSSTAHATPVEHHRGRHTASATASASHAAIRSVAARHLAALLVAVGLVATLTACGGGDGPTSASRSDERVGTPAPIERPTGEVDQLIPIGGGARLHIRCTGAGDATVVLISGFEADGEVWGAVTPEVSRDARVCTYDRFGTGTSDRPPTPQTFSSHADELRELLQASGEPGPYVVVGHSFGGAEAVSFAASSANEVAGLLLLDASPTTWRDASCAVPDDGSDAAHSFMAACAMGAPDGNAERLDVASGFAQVDEIDSLGDLPMVVATASTRTYPGLDPAESARLIDTWNTGQEAWASLSSSAEVLPVDNTGHDIHIDQPAVVVEQIRQLLP